MTPSRSKTTACDHSDAYPWPTWTSAGPVRPALDRDDPADEERVVAGPVLVDEARLDPPEGAFEERRPGSAFAPLDPVPVRERGDAAGEMLGDRLLVAGEQAQREAARVAQELVHGGLRG